jgi:predicted alpha/beta-hydrolase family hydrolase
MMPRGHDAPRDTLAAEQEVLRMPQHDVRIPVDAKRAIDGRLDLPEGRSGRPSTAVIMAHGAANDMQEPLLQHLAGGLCRAGFPVLRFNFPYRTAGRKNPDSQGVLEAAWLAAAAWMRQQEKVAARRLVAGGKSMGARVVSQLVGAGRLTVEGLAFWGYPLHAPGRPHQTRDAHLDAIGVPMLFVEGTRDPFCDLALLEGVLSRLGDRARLEIVEGGDHSFRLPKASPEVDQQAVYDRIRTCTLDWLGAL